MPDVVPPQLQPVRNDGVGAVKVGLGLWAAAGVVMVLRREELAADGRQWWLATCGAGLVIGFIQLAIFVRRRARARAPEHGARAAD